MAARHVAPGITMLRRFGPYKNACWVLHHRGEAALVEMPPHHLKERPPEVVARGFLQRHRLTPRFALLSHAHLDHCAAYARFRETFPRTRFVGHRSLADDPTLRRVLHGADPWETLDEVFEGPIWSADLGGEPLHVLHAPKHSASDHLILFRGAMITGDWVLNDLRDCNRLVDPRVKIRSIERVQGLVRALDYHVHMLFSAHGDHLFYQVDLQAVLEASKVAWPAPGAL